MTTKRIDETEDGDVFYLADDPSVVLWRNNRVTCGPYFLAQLGDECWYTEEDIGTGAREQAVVVVHNTVKHLTKGLAE